MTLLLDNFPCLSELIYWLCSWTPPLGVQWAEQRSHLWELLVLVFPDVSQASCHLCSKAKAQLLETVAAFAVIGAMGMRLPWRNAVFDY